ncbi:serine hydrolase domain-containing protein [Dyella sp.]|uniref:serine hydrolase domain-containing protein n=2 Tax=Dyella sp. TaxID=1869338 RepID=UPI003F7D866C
MTSRVMRASGRLLLAVAILLGLSGCVALLVRGGKRLYQAATKPTASAPVVAAGSASPPAAVRAALEQAVRSGAPGVTAIAMRDGQRLFRLDLGKIAPDAELPVASASKWMTAALVMSVVDEGRLALDAPISRYLPDFTGEAGRITLRELLAQTAGTGSLRDGVDIRQDPRMTLAESAAEVAHRPLRDPPGTVFRYGGPGFQVAGAAVEAVTGRRWADLFDERIARPLGMHHTRWEHLPAHGVSPQQTRNPLLQGGVMTTADDYMRFLTMLAQHGRYGDRQILSAQAVDAMEKVQTLGKPMAYRPPGARDGATQYALGNWCERWTAAGDCTLVSSPGAFGTFPWIDRTSGTYGIFFVDSRLPKVAAYFYQARSAILAQTP